jgi:hypothetical protein
MTTSELLLFSYTSFSILPGLFKMGTVSGRVSQIDRSRSAASQILALGYHDFKDICELSENVFSGGIRLANELQLPRSLRLGVEFEI